jgi:hypothetical protein
MNHQTKISDRPPRGLEQIYLAVLATGNVRMLAVDVGIIRDVCARQVQRTST